MSKGFESKDEPKIKDIRERAFAFAVRIVKLCQYLEKDTKVSRTLITQLLKAGTSVGANLEEAQAGQSKPDFISKNAIAQASYIGEAERFDFDFVVFRSI